MTPSTLNTGRLRIGQAVADEQATAALDWVELRLQRRAAGQRSVCGREIVAFRRTRDIRRRRSRAPCRSENVASSGPSAALPSKHAAAFRIEADGAGGHRRLMVPADDIAADPSSRSRRSQIRTLLTDTGLGGLPGRSNTHALVRRRNRRPAPRRERPACSPGRP